MFFCVFSEHSSLHTGLVWRFLPVASSSSSSSSSILAAGGSPPPAVSLPLLPLTHFSLAARPGCRWFAFFFPSFNLPLEINNTHTHTHAHRYATAECPDAALCHASDCVMESRENDLDLRLRIFRTAPSQPCHSRHPILTPSSLHLTLALLRLSLHRVITTQWKSIQKCLGSSR